MTTLQPDLTGVAVAPRGVYPPQQDSRLLIEVLQTSGLALGRRVVDLGTGSGVIAIAAAKMGARDVTAFDICPTAVACTRANARAAGVHVDVRLGSWALAGGCSPFDVILANPPYVPADPLADHDRIPLSAGPSRAWNAGADGRSVLDPLCDSVAEMLTAGGSMLLVHSDVANVAESLRRLRNTGLTAVVATTRLIPFGPVMRARARWLERTGRVPVGCREEQLFVIRADKSWPRTTLASSESCPTV